MPTDVNNVAEPSAAATPVHYDSWDKDGKPIVSAKEPPKTQDSAPASAPESEAPPASKDETAAESGAAPKQEKKGEKLTAEERVQQAVREKNESAQRVKDLEERLRKLEAAPQPPAKTEPAKQVEPPKRPNPFKWTGTPEEFEQAQSEWEAYRERQAVANFQQQQQYQTAQQKTAEMLKETTAKYPDAETKVRETTRELMTKAPEFVQLFVSDSEVLTDLLYALSDETTLNNLLATAKSSPSKALRVLRDMELDIQKAVTKVPAAEAEAEKKPSPAPDKPRAPKPPSEVGGRGTNLEDAQVTAARSGDYAAFEAEQNRRKFVRA